LCNQYQNFLKSCGEHIYYKGNINTFNYYSYFFDDLYKDVQIKQKMFYSDFGSYNLNLEDFVFSDYGESMEDSVEISEYKNIGNFCLNFSKDSYFIDIGANYGLSAFPAAIRGYNVIAFEPVNINYYLLNKSIEENDIIFKDRIKTYKYAIGDKNKKTKIYVPQFRDNCSLAKESAITNMKNKNFLEEDIDIISFDWWLTQNKNIEEKKIKFIKSDTQGFEYSVVLGMKNFFNKNNDFYVLLEWDPVLLEKAGFNSKILYNFMIENGFEEHSWHSNGDKLFYKK